MPIRIAITAAILPVIVRKLNLKVNKVDDDDDDHDDQDDHKKDKKKND